MRDPVRAGVGDAMDRWLSRHDVSCPGLLGDAARQAFKEAAPEWFERNGGPGTGAGGLRRCDGADLDEDLARLASLLELLASLLQPEFADEAQALIGEAVAGLDRFALTRHDAAQPTSRRPLQERGR